MTSGGSDSNIWTGRRLGGSFKGSEGGGVFIIVSNNEVGSV